jgi:predicted O-methyltransferase YrrM
VNQITTEIYNNFNPLPEDTQGWNGDSYIFAKLIHLVNPRHIVEVGSWKGQSSITMAKYIKSIGSDCKITCIDTWLGAEEFWGRFKDTPERDLMLKNGYPQIYYQFLSNVVHNNVQDVILPLPATSRIGATILQERNQTAQLIYIDASHMYDDVLSDCIEFYGLLDGGGILFGDDFNWDSVRKAVEEFGRKIEKEIKTEENFWWLQK